MPRKASVAMTRTRKGTMFPRIWFGWGKSTSDLRSLAEAVVVRLDDAAMPYRIFRIATAVSLGLFLVIAGTRVCEVIVSHRDYPTVPLGQVWDDSGAHWIFRWPVLPGTAALPSIWLLSVLVRDVMGTPDRPAAPMFKPCSNLPAGSKDKRKARYQSRRPCYFAKSYPFSRATLQMPR